MQRSFIVAGVGAAFVATVRKLRPVRRPFGAGRSTRSNSNLSGTPAVEMKERLDASRERLKTTVPSPPDL